MFPSLVARETYVGETNLAARKQKMFLPEVKNIFVSRTQVLRPKHMFPSLATQGNIRSNNVSATMFPSLARPLRPWLTKTHCCRHKCFPVCPRAQHLLRTQSLCPGHINCFW